MTILTNDHLHIIIGDRIIGVVKMKIRDLRGDIFINNDVMLL